MATSLAGIRPRAYQAERPAQFEAFLLGSTTKLLDTLEAETLMQALGETTARWAWDRGDRFAVREITGQADRLHVYAVRRKSAGMRVWNRFESSVEHGRWAEHICTIDLNVIAGISIGAVGVEIDLHDRRQRQRPEGARLERRA